MGKEYFPAGQCKELRIAPACRKKGTWLEEGSRQPLRLVGTISALTGAIHIHVKPPANTRAGLCVYSKRLGSVVYQGRTQIEPSGLKTLRCQSMTRYSTTAAGGKPSTSSDPHHNNQTHNPHPKMTCSPKPQSSPRAP